MKSLRYQDLGSNVSPPGLKCLVLNGNTELGDKGLQRIIVDLKDDEWIKGIRGHTQRTFTRKGSWVGWIKCVD